MIDADKTRAWRSDPVRHAYTSRDTILYALGVGAGADPLDPHTLRLTWEKDLLALPTMAAVIASPGAWMRDRTELGIDFVRLVHGEQGITLHRPLPAAGTLVGVSRVTRLVDKGAGKGALMHVEKSLTDEASGELVATAEQVLFLRGDGGFSAHARSDEPAPAPAPTPDTPADVQLDIPTRPDAALLYRLSGDLNPLHVDPAFAARAGFARPILHGLATYGMAAQALIHACLDHDPRRVKSIHARLSAPVVPGETLRLEAWKLASDRLAFRVKAVPRDLVVLSHGRVGA